MLPASRSFVFAAVLAGLFFPPALRAQTTITFQPGDTKSDPITATAIDPYTLTIASGSATQSGAIAGAGSVTKTGAGTLAVTGDSSGHTGTLNLAGGVLAFNRSSDLTYSGTVTGSGTLRQAANNVLTLTGNLSGHTGTLNLFSGSGTINLNPGANASYGGTITGTGTLRKSGTTTLTLTGTASSFAGGITVTAGTLAFGSGTDLGTGSSAVSVSLGATLDTGGHGLNLARLSGSGTVNANSVFSPFTYTFGVRTISAILTGATVLSISGTPGFTANLTLTGANTYSSGTVISNGTLTLGASGVIADASNVFLADNSTFNLAGFSETIGSLGSNAFNQGLITLGSGTLTVNHTNTQIVSSYYGVISGAGSLVKSGAGLLRLLGASTFTGGTTINGGTLQLGLSGRLADTSSVTIGAGGTFELNNVSDTIGALSGAGNITLGSGTLTTNSGTSTAFSGVISGAGSFAKSGAGVLTLSGANLYTGTTNLSAGGLIVNGSLANTTVNVASGATLGGSGTLGGLATFASGSHLAPGNSPGTLTFTNGLTLNNGMILDFEFGTVSDLIRVSGGTLTGSSGLGGITLNLSDAGGFAPATYLLLDFTGATLSDFNVADFSLGNTISGYHYSLALNGSHLELTAAASAIPEPPTYAFIGGLSALGLVMIRRRARQLQERLHAAIERHRGHRIAA